jgi:hypothetical protein
MPELQCQFCGANATVVPPTGAHTVIICPRCGGYRLSHTAEAMLQAETLQRPTPEAFAALVKRKRGDSAEYPVITSYDLGG